MLSSSLGHNVHGLLQEDEVSKARTAKRPIVDNKPSPSNEFLPLCVRLHMFWCSKIPRLRTRLTPANALECLRLSGWHLIKLRSSTALTVAARSCRSELLLTQRAPWRHIDVEQFEEESHGNGIAERPITKQSSGVHLQTAEDADQWQVG